MKIFDVVLCLSMLIRGSSSAQACSNLVLTGDWLKQFEHYDLANHRYEPARKLYTASNTIEKFVTVDFSLRLLPVLFPDDESQIVVLQKRFDLLTGDDEPEAYRPEISSSELPENVVKAETAKIAMLIGNILGNMHHKTYAFRWHKLSYEITQSIYGEGHPNVVFVRNILGISLMRAGRVRW